jgi:hypothetical protein
VLSENTLDDIWSASEFLTRLIPALDYAVKG